LAYSDGQQKINIRLEKINQNGAVYIHTSEPGKTSIDGPPYEELFVLILYS
jgi:hypothetical protein